MDYKDALISDIFIRHGKVEPFVEGEKIKT
jgi:hypothetical protein